MISFKFGITVDFQVLLRDGNITNAHRAERILSHSTLLLPDYPSADFNRGLAFSTMGNKTEAIRLMQVALRKNIDSQANVYAYVKS
jgi:predicted Zn-dependent protease